MTQPFNIIDLFLAASEKHPDRAAIIYKSESVSFGEFRTQVIQTAAYFKKKGITAGDRVLIFVPMSVGLYRIVLALFYIGATAVFLDEWVSKRRMEECCRIARCRAFVGIWKIKLLSVFSAELRKIPIRLGVSYRKAENKSVNKHPTSLSDTALITFTTGTTGTPKAAKRTHGFLKEQFNALIEKIDPQEGETDMPALPIVLMINLGAGCTSVIPDFKASRPDEMDAEKIWQQIVSNKVQRIVASPFFIKRLSEYVIHNKITKSPLQKIFTGGAPVFPDEAELYANAFPGSKTEIVYGSTEAEPISSIGAITLVKEKNSLLEKGLNVGVPYRKTKVRIINIISGPVHCCDETELDAITVADGTIGEIIVSGPHVLREYFNNEEALFQNKIFIGADCWHRTGDSGYLQNEDLYLTGRVNSLIIYNDNLLSPFIYQNYLQSIPGVEMGTIVKQNNNLIVVLELQKNTGKEKIIDQIKNLPPHFDEVRILKSIPRDPRHYSRIEYEKLRQLLA